MNKEALIEKARLWEQRANEKQETLDQRKGARRETSKEQREIDGQLIGALHAKLSILDSIKF